MTTERDILEKAIDVLEEEGWQRGVYGDPTNAVPHCAVGAIFRACWLSGMSTMDEPGQGAIAALYEVIPKGPGTYLGSVERWNDAEARNIAEVTDTFKKAVKAVIRREEQLGLEEAS